MKRMKWFELIILFVALISFQGCCNKCIGVGNIPLTAPANAITHNDITVKAAILPSGTPSSVSVEDKIPPAGEHEIWIGWSETNTGPAEYAMVLFDSTALASGLREVCFTCTHYKSCRLEAYNLSGGLVGNAVHTAGQGNLQKLSIAGSHIWRVDVIGAEILITKICVRE